MTKMLPLLLLALLSNIPFIKRKAWKKFYQMFATIAPERFSLMNYGYSAGEVAEHLEGREEKYALELYRRVAAPATLTDREVLEVGCGRGGGAGYLARQFQPRRYVGLDLSQNAAGICQNQNGDIASFLAGDAQDLPFASEAFDVVLNVESAFCYPSRERFYQEVHRVLKPAGLFLCADIEKREKARELPEMLTSAGFIILENELINDNVLKASDDDAARRRSFIDRLYGDSFLRRPFYNFVALPGSQVYRMLSSHALCYMRFAAQKNEA